MTMPGNMIRQLRKEKGITQEQLAEALNVSVAAVSKWETGQSAPELSLLCCIADYFAVSVDALLGHSVHRERLDCLLQAMAQARQSRDDAALRGLIERTMQGYPNVSDAVEACAEACYALFVQHQDRDALGQSIALTERLFALDPHMSASREIDLLASLANQYELRGDWEKALQYYEKSSVAGSQAAHVARCRLRLGQPNAALTALSDHLQEQAFMLFQQVNTLQEIHTELSQPEKALQALSWGCSLLGGMGSNAYLSMLLCMLQVQRAVLLHGMGNAAASEAAFAEAQHYAEIADADDQSLPDFAFLRVSKRRETLVSQTSCAEMLRLVAAALKAE